MQEFWNYATQFQLLQMLFTHFTLTQREREREREGIEHASGIYFIIKSKSEYKEMVFTKVVQDGYACRVTISHLPTMDKALLKAVGMSMSSSFPPGLL